MKNILYAYMAGFVDADGSISITTVSKAKVYVTKITVTNCDERVMWLFRDEFGGKVRCREWKNKNWRPGYEWTLTSVKAQTVIKLILPYLRIKRKQAFLVLRLGKLKAKYNGAVRRWDRKLSGRCDRVYSKLKDKCKALNKRGVTHAS